ncbi:unnamed protein product [Schistosoma mattheei]|uniref:Uncharacterized protein n=1 Tax=Schistosoma mattheei TaxID=31246 RepID=A0AA85C367_9TREM|nr:unnamed protein product [Schistosoma mattheei]
MDTSTNELINILKYDHLLIISTYTRTVLILVAVLIGVMLLVIVISWQLFQKLHTIQSVLKTDQLGGTLYYTLKFYETQIIFINMLGIVQIIPCIYIIRSKVPNISTYARKVLIILNIQLLITLFIRILFLLPFIAVVTALLIAFVKEISDTFPLNVITLFIYTMTLATAIEILDILVGMGAKLDAFGISLTLFTSALLIGAAIKTRLADYLTAIVILLIIAAILIAVASILITIFKHSSAAIIFYILTDILLFVITIFVSQITVGKLQLRIFCTEYTLAALLLYNMFSATYLTTTGMICNITSTCNSSNASIYSFNNLPGYII